MNETAVIWATQVHANGGTRRYHVATVEAFLAHLMSLPEEQRIVVVQFNMNAVLSVMGDCLADDDAAGADAIKASRALLTNKQLAAVPTHYCAHALATWPIFAGVPRAT